MELKCKNCGTYVAEIPADTEWLLVERCSECPQQEPNRALSNYIQDHGSEVNACVGEPAAEVLLRLLEHYAKPCPHCEDTANQLADRNRQLAAVRKWMAEHAMEPVYSTAIAELSYALNWVDEDTCGECNDVHEVHEAECRHLAKQVATVQAERDEALAVAERAVGIAERLIKNELAARESTARFASRVATLERKVEHLTNVSLSHEDSIRAIDP